MYILVVKPIFFNCLLCVVFPHCAYLKNINKLFYTQVKSLIDIFVTCVGYF